MKESAVIIGQYHYTVNLDKKQFLYPHKLGDGLKLHEQCGWSPGGTNDALHMLLACSNGRGGGDFQDESPLIGSWAGDRIAVIGDYAEPGDIPGGVFDAKQVYESLHPDEGESEYKDITDELVPVLEREYECVYIGDDEWRNRFQLSDIEGYAGSDGVGDRNIRIGKKCYRSSDVRAALKAKVKKYQKEKVTVEFLGLEPVKPKTRRNLR